MGTSMAPDAKQWHSGMLRHASGHGPAKVKEDGKRPSAERIGAACGTEPSKAGASSTG